MLHPPVGVPWPGNYIVNYIFPQGDCSNTLKLHILEWPFIVASLRHTCAIIMLSNQHLDMPKSRLWVSRKANT